MPSPPASPPKPAEAGHQPRRFLIVVGTSRYELLDEDDQLPLVDGEVQRITRLFARFGYDQVLPELAENPGVDALRRGLSRWCKSSDRRADDIVVVYYSGHGGVDEDGQHYLLVSDSEWHDLYGTALAAEGIAKALVGSPLRQVLVILDTCWAGAGTADLETVAARLAQTRRVGDQVGAGLWFIAAARAKDRAEPSVFVEAFTRAVELADPGRLQQYLDPHWVVEAVNDELTRRRRPQRVSCSVSDSTALPPFLLNPHHDPDAVANVDVEAQRLAAQERRRDQQDARYRQDLLEHFGPRSRGVEFEAEPGWYFTGREQVLRELTAWLETPVGDQRARVVTGEPGSGKSAVLARLVTLADPDYRRNLPLDEVPTNSIPMPGSIDLAVHARRRRLEDLVEAIAVRAGVDAVGVDGLLAALAAQRRRLVVVVDGLDEAGGGAADETNEPRRIARKLLRPLAAIPGVRLLVGSRRPLLHALGPDKVVLDLDLPRYVERADLAEYARRLLLADDDPDRTTPYQTEHALASTVAAAVAERADRCFLVARIVARSLASASAVIDVNRPDWWRFPEEVGQAFDDYLEQFGDSTRRVRRLLAPLVYAEGAGLPREELWAALATALSGEPCSDDDIGWLLDQAGAYIVEATEHDRSVYRLYHQALVEHLRDPGREPEVQGRIARLLLQRVPTSLDRTQRDWFMAHPYIRTHLATHAAAAGMLDELFLDPGYLLVAAPLPLLRAAHIVSARTSQRARHAYRQASESLQTGARDERLAYLLLAAQCARADELVQRIDALRPILPWRACWAHWRAGDHRRLTTLVGDVRAVAVTELDGRPVVVSGGDDRTVRVWELDSGTPIGEPFRGHTGAVRAVAVGQLDGRPVVVSGSMDGTVQVSELDSGTPVGVPFDSHETGVTAVAVGQLDGRPVVVSGGMDGTLRVRELDSGASVVEPFHGHMRMAELSRDVHISSEVTAMAVTELDGRPVVVSGGMDGGVWVRKLSSGAPVDIFYGHTVGVRAVAVGELDGRPVVVSGGMDGTVRVRELGSGAPVGEPFHAHETGVTAVAVAELNRRPVVITGGDVLSPSLRVWELDSGAPIGEPFHGHERGVRAVAVAELDRRPVVVSGSGDGTVRVWELDSGTPIGEPFHGHERGVTAVAVAELDSQSVVVSGSGDRTVRVWELDSGTPIGEPFHGHTGGVTAVAVTELNGRPVVVSGSMDGTVQVSELDSGTPIGEPFRGHERGVRAVAVGQLDGQPVVVSGGDDRTVQVWKLDSGTPIGEPFRGHEHGVTAVAVGQLDGRPVVVSGGYDGTVRVWSAAGTIVEIIRIGTQALDLTYGGDRVLAATTLGLVAFRLSSVGTLKGL